MSNLTPKDIVHLYYTEVIDQGKLILVDESHREDCVVHRPEEQEPIVGRETFKQVMGKFLNIYEELESTIHTIIEEGDFVATRVSHLARLREAWPSRIGIHNVAGKPVHWKSQALFFFREGKIAEEWVNRDELGMLIDLEILNQRE
jgi:predicted ester cyclase